MTAERAAAGAPRRRLAQPRVAETIAAELRARILAADGEGLRLPPQDQLVKEFGVSYPSVREAIRILETEGLVTVQRGSVGGAQVHRPDDTSAAYHLGLALQGAAVTLSDLASGLLLLEPLCVAECAGRADRARTVVPALRANLERAGAVVEDGVAFTRTAREFHALVVQWTPNATVRHVVSSLVRLWSAQEQAWARSLASQGEYPSGAAARTALRAHRHLVEDIAAGRAQEAERRARTHLSATQRLLLERFGDGVVDATSAEVRSAIQAGQGRGL